MKTETTSALAGWVIIATVATIGYRVGKRNGWGDAINATQQTLIDVLNEKIKEDQK